MPIATGVRVDCFTMAMQRQQQELQQLIDLLPFEEDEVIQSFIKSFGGTGVPNHYEKVQTLLIASPYPTLQILHILYNQSKFHIGRIVSTALKQMLDNDDASSSTLDTTKSRFLSVLANFPQQILEVATVQQKLLDRLVTDSCGNNEYLMLALLARQDSQLLKTILQKREQQQEILCSNAAPTAQLVLQLALNQREHFVPRVCQQLKNFECIDDLTLRNNLLILRLANEFALGSQTLDELAQLDQTLSTFDITGVPAELQPVQRFFYADFQRLGLLLKFLQQQQGGNACKTIKVDTLLRAPGVLTLIYENGIQCDNELVVKLIEDTYKWQQQTPALKCVRSEELETWSYFTALCHAYNIIVELHESSVREQLLLLSAQLRQLRELSTLCSLLEDIFQLVFIRWEQLQNSKPCDGDDDDDEQYVDDEATPPRTTNPPSVQKRRYGFICRAPALYALFSYLKSFVTKKLHTQDFKYATEEQQRCFQRLVDAISEALWKFSVLQKIEQSLAKAAAPASGYSLEPEQLLQLIQLHSHSKEKASSDDESRERSYHASSLTRRKSRRQRRAASFSGAAESRSADVPTLEQCRARAHQLLLSGGAHNKEPKLAAAQPKDRSIIPKMLSTPEQLAIMALALKNFNDVKYIIETFHLEQSQLSRELQFMENQQHIKQKLANIYANYETLAGEAKTTKSNSTTTTTVEQIKSVAAKGFELSKIISVVDNFAQSQKLQHSAELRSLLQRHSANAQYGFLQQFQERNLNVLIVCDLIINLSFNREITCNLLLVIRRQQQHQLQQQQSAVDSSNEGNPREIGAMYLMENLCECMRLLERAGRKPALNKLLCRHSYSLRPVPLALQLQRETVFTTLYQKNSADYAHSRDLRVHASLFQQFKSRHNYYSRFCGYVQQLARLLQLRDANLEYHNSQLLRHDPYQIIGELIYDCDITPLEIEGNVAALHLNLVHVIALNICPQLAEGTVKHSQRCVSDQKQESIHNYIAQHNQLLAQLLQAIQLADLPAIELPETSLNFSCLRQLMQLPEMSTLALMHEDNTVMAALHAYKLKSVTLNRLKLNMELQLRILLLDIGGQGEPVAQLKNRVDRLISELIAEDARHIQLAAHINDLGLRAQLLQQHFTKISSSQLAKELIERTLQHRMAERAIPHLLRRQLEHTLSDITVYASVSGLLQFESWPQAYDFGRQTPNVIFEQLLQGRHYELCHEWCRMVQLTDSAGQQRVCLVTLLETFLRLNDEDVLDPHLLHIAELFPTTVLVNFLDTHKDKMRSLALLQWLVNYLQRHARDSQLYLNYQLSLELLRQLPHVERLHFWPLLRYPLLIIEQLVMNTRFEMLTKLLEPVRTKLQQRIPLGPCSYCFEKRGHAYDVHNSSTTSSGDKSTGKLRFQLGQTSSEAFILLNFNSYQQDHVIGNDCLDLLLRIYASKALDYHIADVRAGPNSEQGSFGTDVQNSLDSLCGAFQMPKQAPSREQWTPDEDATHCMCCRRSAFTMLMRRHHCRRCGRVVCYACSTQRMVIPELYGDVEVRVCNDCCIPIVAEKTLLVNDTASVGPRASSIPSDSYKWRLSGIITHDKLLREEFCYEHAPSVALSLSILRHHLDQRQCVDLLLFHCRKLEKLIVPNPEVDYELVAKMMNCLALAAKVRGAPSEFETIREHSEIIMAVVQQGCESLIPAGPLNNHSMRQLADALVETEHWKLALEVHLKWGFATTGVMAAHGLACLRAGCYDAAREKFAHCMTRLSTEEQNSCIYKDIFGKDWTIQASQTITPASMPKKRSQRGPALLQEILQLIATMPQAQPQPETLQRASLIRNSNTSLASLFSRRREPYVVQTPLREPALNVINTLANLKHIAKGQYGEPTVKSGTEDNRQSRAFEESLHYVLTYGSHADILQFLMQRDEMRAALRYWQQQQLDPELFILHIFQVSLASGRLPFLIEELQQMDADSQLNSWRVPLLQTCRYLEQQQHLNSLYQLQLLLKDPVRASMTCVKFYPLHCENFQKLHANAQHLKSAHMHLQGELDLAQWEHLQREQQQAGSRRASAASSSAATTCFAMQLDARALNGHINTIRRQMELAKFLAHCEREQAPVHGLLCTLQILKQIRLEALRGTLPTLFDGAADKIQLCILVLLCGKNIDEGFGLAYGILQDYKLAPMKVFGATAKYLAKNERLSEVDRLLDCIASNNGNSSTAESDELLSIAVNAAVHSNEPETKQALDKLVKRIGNVELRIASYIFIGQLKSAYLLANKHERLADIRKILREAEMTNQIHIKKLCEKKLNINSTAMSPTTL